MSSASTPLMPRTPPEPVSAADGDNDNVKIVAAAAVESELRSAGLEIFGDASAVGGSAGEDAVNYGSNNIIQQKNTNNHHEDDVPEKDNMLDSLLFAAALASGPHFTRHHYHHTFHPNLSPLSISPALSSRSGTPSLSPTSSVSSGLFGLDIDDEYNVVETPTVARPAAKNDVTVKCMVRTRVPTPHGEVFLHLYHNNRDDKEHLAIVIDPAQLDYDGSKPPAARFIRSKSLDSVWHEDETPMERITRGAYIGRLSEDGYTVSSPNAMEKTSPKYAVPAPLVRIHSECFTGETIGSMRCDCGEQLDEAMRRIAEPITFNDSDTNAIPGRGAVIYMRQEGRGIGLLAKLRAYNLQDLGHDTVQANLLLGRGADERGYDVAAAIVRDLGLDDDEEGGRAGESGIRLLTNNPDKVEKLTDEGVHVLERVPMVPRTWRCQDESEAVKDSSERMTAEPGSKMDIHDMDAGSDAAARLRSAGATLIGASATRGPELEKYLRTKVLRMGHMLSLPSI